MPYTQEAHVTDGRSCSFFLAGGIKCECTEIYEKVLCFCLGFHFNK